MIRLVVLWCCAAVSVASGAFAVYEDRVNAADRERARAMDDHCLFVRTEMNAAAESAFRPVERTRAEVLLNHLGTMGWHAPRSCMDHDIPYPPECSGVLGTYECKLVALFEAQIWAR